MSKKLPNEGTKAWLEKKLTELKIDFDSDLKKPELEELYEETLKAKEEDATVEENAKVEEKVVETMRASSRVYIREEATQESPFIRVLETNEIITVHEIVDGWAKVDEGFVMASYLF